MDSREHPPSPPPNMMAGPPSYTATTTTTTTNVNSSNYSSMMINPRKRSRPGEYSPDGNIALSLTRTPGSASFAANHEETAGALAGTGHASLSEPLLKKHRGHPPGSGKKQLDALGAGGVGFTPHVIMVKAGEDIASKIMVFSQQGPCTVCILPANGAICSVTLRQPAMSGGTVTYEVPIRRGMWVKWHPPPAGQLKLNVDGSSKNANSAGGGVCRDSTGSIIIAFNANFGRGCNVHAEANALLVGLEVCSERGLMPEFIESDSLCLVQCLQKRCKMPWRLEHTISKCASLMATNAFISHIFREGNGVADRLANVGHNVQHLKVFTQQRSLPRSCLKAFRQDKLGLSSYRPP